VAPQNPIRGMFWWDGKRLWLFDGAVWVDVVDSAIKAGSGAGAGGGTGSGGVIISTTPPASPLPGEEWWNGSQLFVWDGTAWKLVGPGAAAGPTPTSTHIFAIQQTTGLSIPATGWSTINFSGTPNIDPQGMYSPTTHQLTPTKAGLYYFTARGNSGGSGGGVALVKNDSGSFTGNQAAETIVGIQSNSVAGWMTAQGFSDMNGTTDFVRMWGRDALGNWQNTGSNNMLSAWLMP
jgi:hypothetical protein